MQRAQRISDIVKKRKPLVQKIEAVQANLNSLGQDLRSLEEYRDELADRVDDKAIAGRLRAIEVGSLLQNIVSELRSLDKLKTRFSRNTLNIAVVGRARQGKSRLLQSLTGLTSAEIPDGSGQHCTGVRSTIVHNPSLEPSAEVYFHTERSFLGEVISPYYDQLELGAKPITVGEFSNHALPPLPQNKSGGTVGAKYEHLQRYHTHFAQYRDLLHESSPRRITRDEIRAYVAQDNVAGEREYYNYLAVRDVKITCRFPNDDVGQIALVDLPGLGDTGIGDAERLIATLSQDIDLVLFVRRPILGGDFLGDVDVSLYDTARSALKEIPLEKWSFLVFNRTDESSDLGDNLKQCKDLSEDLANKHITVSKSIIANCADEEEAKTKILDRILEYLEETITELDQHYVAAFQDRLEEIRSGIDSELEKSRTALGQAKSDDAAFQVLFNDLWKEMNYGLKNLLDGLRGQRAAEDNKYSQDFRRSVEEIIKKCRDDAGIPPLEDIKRAIAVQNSAQNAYNDYLDETRAHLSQKFLELDKGLEHSFDRMKSQVAKVLIEHGGLGGLTDIEGAKFIEVIEKSIPTQLITEATGNDCEIKKGFEILSDFTLSYRGFAQHRIRKCLDDLTPDTTKLPLDLSSADGFQELDPPKGSFLMRILKREKSSPTEQIENNLKTLHDEAVSKCETALNDLLYEPSEAGFAIVEEFLDRILRAKGVETEWRIFLGLERYKIWPKKFGLLGEGTSLRKGWLSLIERVGNANQVDSLQFIA